MGLLILRRKPREAVLIGKSITVWVLGVEGDRVKLGFDAPDDVVIIRAELDGAGAPPLPPLQSPQPPQKP